jgi:hypothetical protein
MEGIGEKNGILPYPYSICYSQQGMIVVYTKSEGGKFGFSKESSIIRV